ncbi:MAG TPA: hypothetical protein EYP57_00335 [Thermodesulfobacteriaceae bacterium]|nr:hypothetical protein [Thermodesulfobacteriaceae bacterium]
MSEKEKTREIWRHIDETADYARSADLEPEFQKAIEENIAKLKEKISAENLEIVAFGTVSGCKSSVLNVLAGDDRLATDVRGGTTVKTIEIPWTDRSGVSLVDTPGLGEADGGIHGRTAREAAR